MANSDWKTNGYWKTVSTVVVLVFAGLATLAYALRMYAVRISSGKRKVEDYLMGIGLLLSYGATVATVLNAFNGVGVPAHELPPAEKNSLNFGSWIIQKFWPTSMAFIKISIIFFLRRLFGARPIVRRCLDLLSVIIAMWATAALLTNIFQCWPPSYYYNKNQKGHCMPGQKQFFMAMGSLALIEDTVILLIPMPTIWTLKVQLRQKIAVTIILSLGSLVCIFSLLRIIEFRNFILTDLSSSSALESIFTCLEMNIATICGCLPFLRPVFRKFLPSTNGGRLYGRAGSSNQPNFQSSLFVSGRTGANQFQKLSDLKSSATAAASKPQGSSSKRNETRTSSEIELRGINVSTSMHQEVRPASILDSND